MIEVYVAVPAQICSVEWSCNKLSPRSNADEI